VTSGTGIPADTLAVLELLHARCPGWELHPGRVALLLEDFPTADALAAASATADFLNHRQSGRVRDAHTVLRRELERRALPASGGGGDPSSSPPSGLSIYDRFES
jgi:hypothetical protein